MKESIEYKAMEKFLSSKDKNDFFENWSRYKELSSFDYKYYDKSQEETFER